MTKKTKIWFLFKTTTVLFSQQLLMRLQHEQNLCILHQVHTSKVGFYIGNIFLLFFNFGFYNLAHSEVTVFHSAKPEVGITFMKSHQVMLCQPEN